MLFRSGLWYTFTGNGDDVTLSTCAGSSYDTKLSVFSGTCLTPVCVGGSDDAPGCPGNTSRVVIPTIAGTSYLVFVHGYNDAQGTFTLSMTCSAPCGPLENDECASATELSVQVPGGCEASTGTTVCAYAATTDNPPCDPFGNIVASARSEHEQLVAAGIAQRHAVVRGLGDGDLRQPLIAANAMFGGNAAAELRHDAMHARIDVFGLRLRPE